MKQRDLIRHVEKHGCVFKREGGCHTVYVNLSNRQQSTIPRHKEVNDLLAKKICKDLGIPSPF